MRRTAAVAMAIVQMIKNFRIIVQTVQRRHQAANWHKIDKKLSGRKAHEINSHRQLILKPSGEYPFIRLNTILSSATVERIFSLGRDVLKLKKKHGLVTNILECLFSQKKNLLLIMGFTRNVLNMQAWL